MALWAGPLATGVLGGRRLTCAYLVLGYWAGLLCLEGAGDVRLGYRCELDANDADLSLGVPACVFGGAGDVRLVYRDPMGRPSARPTQYWATGQASWVGLLNGVAYGYMTDYT